MSSPVIMSRPYLNYGIPSELSRINSIKAAITARFNRKRRNALVAGAALAPEAGAPLRGASSQSDSDASADPRMGGSTATAPNNSGRMSRGAASGRAEGALVKSTESSAPQKLAQQSAMVTVTPSGQVSMGFNCEQTFTAEANSGPEGDEGAFSIQFSKSGSVGFGSVWQDAWFIGESKKINKKESWIKFQVGPGEYSIFAQGGFDFFRIVWGEPTLSGWVEWPSAPIKLVWNAPPCNEIHAVRFHVGGVDVGTECRLKGSQNGQDPAFHVVLTAPAQPGGQVVRVRSTNTALGWIMPNKPHYDLVIPAGQITASVSWFLGTKKVARERSFHLEARLVFPEGGESTRFGLGSIVLTK